MPLSVFKNVSELWRDTEPPPLEASEGPCPGVGGAPDQGAWSVQAKALDLLWVGW